MLQGPVCELGVPELDALDRIILGRVGLAGEVHQKEVVADYGYFLFLVYEVGFQLLLNELAPIPEVFNIFQLLPVSQDIQSSLMHILSLLALLLDLLLDPLVFNQV